MEKKAKKVVIHVSGGMVQRVYSDDPDIEIIVEDEDTEEYNPDEKEDTTNMTQVY